VGTKNINYDVCVAHLKWGPCLTKRDWESECHIVQADWATQLMHDYHNATISIDEAMQRVKNNIGQQTFVRCVHAIA